MGALIDTSVLIAAERRRLPWEDVIATLDEEDLCLSVITVSELMHGVYRSKSPGQVERRLGLVEALIGTVPVLPIDLPVSKTHARIWVDLSARGITIGPHDLWIAVTGLTLGHAVITANVR